MRRQRDRPQLEALLREQIAFLNASAASYDGGFDAEAKRLAVTLRVLLHNTSMSHSLLGLLGIKEKFRYVNTAEPINRTNLLPQTFGLVIAEITTGVGARYVPPLGMERQLPPRQEAFEPWWQRPATKDGDRLLSRRDFVLTLANTEGGAHVDPDLDEAWEKLSKEGARWTYVDSAGERPFDPGYETASVRQIAYEVQVTMDTQLDSVLGSSLLTPAG